MKTYANPINLEYQYQVQDHGKKPPKQPYRSAADPSFTTYCGRYFVFASWSRGYFHSDDLVNWNYIRTKSLPEKAVEVAPASEVIDGKIYCTDAGVKSPFYASSDPLNDKWEFVNNPMDLGDPALFCDDDGRVYIYQNRQNFTAPDGTIVHHVIIGAELDAKTFELKSEWKVLIDPRQETRGWERIYVPGTTEFNHGWNEGAEMNKYHGKYYLHYATAGTENPGYADCFAISDSPLGDFVVSASNPFSLKTEGFMCGSGHGTNDVDQFGNHWHFTNMVIADKHPWERRIGLFPTFIDRDGILHSDTRFGDYPHRIPDCRLEKETDLFLGWMLQSFGAEAKASSELENHPARLVVEESSRSYWIAADRNPATVELKLQQVSEIHTIQVNFMEHEADPHQEYLPSYMVEASLDGIEWKVIVDERNAKRDLAHPYYEMAQPIQGQYFRLTIYRMSGNGYPAVRALRLFGTTNEVPAPSAANPIEITRAPGSFDNTVVKLRWKLPEYADGCNVLWGIAPDKLYQCATIYGEEKQITSLLKDQPYYFALEFFGRGGVAPKSDIFEPFATLARKE